MVTSRRRGELIYIHYCFCVCIYHQHKFDGNIDVDRNVNVTCERTLTDVSPDYAFLSTLIDLSDDDRTCIGCSVLVCQSAINIS